MLKQVQRDNEIAVLERIRLPKKRRRKLPAGGLGVSPSLNIPQEWGIKGVDEDFFSSLRMGHNAEY